MKRTVFDKSLYSDAERKKGALWPHSWWGKKADDKLRGLTEKVWAKATDAMKYVAYKYSIRSGHVNYPLRDGNYDSAPASGKIKSINPHDGFSPKHTTSVSQINDLTNMVASSRLEHSFTMNRAIDYNGVASLFGIKSSSFQHALKTGDLETISKALEGKTAIEHAFMSGGCADGVEYDINHDGQYVVFEVFCPKGTQGLYMEPFAFANNAPYNTTYNKSSEAQTDNVTPHWDSVAFDGKQKQQAGQFSNQQEMILQRGTEVAFRGVKYEGGKVRIMVDVISQPEFNN